MTSTIHVAPARLREGEPAIVVEEKGAVRFGTEVFIGGPSRVIQNESGMHGRGQIKAWIETDADVKVTDE